MISIIFHVKIVLIGKVVDKFVVYQEDILCLKILIQAQKFGVFG